MSGDRINPAAGNMPVQPQAPPPPAPQGQGLQRMTNFLLENDRIGNVRSRYDKYRRYVTLYSTQIFQSLVTLYISLFNSQWQHYRRFMEHYPTPAGIPNAPTYMARVYISTWFMDLYATNREAVRGLSPLAFNEKFSHEIIPYSKEYDQFLTLLSGSIRPTPILLTSEVALYIPLIADTINWYISDNPLGINNFILNSDIFYGLIEIMKDRKHWKFSPISTHTTGRPCWLFDWHDNNVVCAWFPRDQNYNDDDVALAYVTGVACTPKLAPRDVDDWQYVPSNYHHPSNIHSINRLESRRFYGSYEVRTIEDQADYLLPPHLLNSIETICLTPIKRKFKKKAPSGIMAMQIASAPTEGDMTSTSTEVEVDPVSVNRFRIIDWCYYSRVVLEYETHTRTGALRIISLN
uniref:Coat protein n=1 Tax=Pittosporum cryptic virus-1 TaxID=748427 RepID=A0A140KP51_9VIRU|nr:coat protein [Pittosporum cryptic virus-1]